MDKSELAKLGYDTSGLVAGIDYVPELMVTEDGIVTDFVERAQLQASELNAMGGVSVLGGPHERLGEINLALDEGVDLVAAVERFGNQSQQMRARQLIDGGLVSN
ncbi:MAG: hypothetical protein ACTIC1_09770 [Brevibacterium sp.]